jgi:predicted CXXCH cytochrome family protein
MTGKSEDSMTNIFRKFKMQAVRCNRRRAAIASLTLLAVGVISCATVHRAVVVLPNYPGAKYIGSGECEQCHEDITRTFPTADHARLIANGPNALGVGCESCHGPCSIHFDSGGEIKPPNSFTAGRTGANSFGRLSLEDPARADGTARATEKVCFQCHADVRGQFSLPNHHPVPEGRMSCTDCHSPHKGSIYHGGGTSLLSENDNCLTCHPAQRGPKVFEHEALREGCTVCHTAHGSVNAKLLTARNANLCMKCHFQQVTGGRILIGGSDHTLRVQQGTCWTAGCHEAVHGSQVSSSLRF